MDMLNDPDMKEVVEGFCDESLELFSRLEDLLDELEEDPNNVAKLEEFGQVIDRVMGAAKSIGADQVGAMCELGKTIGYKASQIHDPALLEIVVAVMFDNVDILTQMVTNLKQGKGLTLGNINTAAFVKRLRWLSDKFKSIGRSSVSIEADNSKPAIGMTDQEASLEQTSIDDLLSDLGL